MHLLERIEDEFLTRPHRNLHHHHCHLVSETEKRRTCTGQASNRFFYNSMNVNRVLTSPTTTFRNDRSYRCRGSKQWAADKTISGAISEAPQIWDDPYWTELVYSNLFLCFSLTVQPFSIVFRRDAFFLSWRLSCSTVSPEIINITATKKHKIQEVMKGKPGGCFFENSISIEDNIFSLLSMIQFMFTVCSFYKS